MASPAAILRAAQASPGGRPTPAPQGSYPWMGALPQYSLQPPNGYAPTYGPFLPRPPETFTSGAFGPFSPILPVPVDQPPPGAVRPQPRRWQYRVGHNLPVGEPGTEGYRLASFGTLKALADHYSIMRTCLEIRKNEIRALDWDIVLTKDAAKAYQGDREAMRDWGERRSKLMRFFSKPDPNYFDFSSWLYAMLEQVFVYDALSLFLCPTKGNGRGSGLLGSGLDSIWAIDGASIRPLVGLHGEMPAPPAPAYEQYIYGVPRSDYTTMFDGRDMREEDFTADDLRGEFRGDQLLYLPYVPRMDSPYGFSLVEQAIIPIMTGLRKQAYQLSFFDEKTVPAVYVSPGDSSMTPNQIRELSDALNAIAGDIAWSFKVIVLPPGSKVMPQKEMQIVDQADEWIATEVCMVASINPMEVGILPKVSTVQSPFAARELAQAQRSIHQRIATKPTLSFVQSIFDLVIQSIAGCTDTRFLFSGMEEVADQAAMTDMGIKQIQSGALSIDEFRDMTGRVPWDLPETSEPIVMTQMGPVPLAQAQDYMRAQINGQSGGSSGGAGNGTKRKPSAPSGTGAHAAAQGHARALPAGGMNTSGRPGSVTERQRARGGSLAPQHATGTGAPGRATGKPAPKAALAELEALGRHLRKGRDVATWEPVWLPGGVLETVALGLGDGQSVATAVAGGLRALEKTLVLGAGEYEWAAKAARSPKAQRRQQRARRKRQQLAQRYTQRVQQAFTQAVAQARGLVAQWVAGTLTVTAAVLAGMIASLVQAALLGVLVALWRAAWALGATAAREQAGNAPGVSEAMDAALEAFLASHGADLAGLISRTRMTALVDALKAAVASGDPSQVAHVLEDILRVASRAGLIAETEVTRAANAAALVVFKLAGVAYKTWETRRDGKVCAVCLGNQNQGPVPLDALFPSGDAQPPSHPRCRCWTLPWVPPEPTASKALTRQVGLNGQIVWAEGDDEVANPAGGGAPSPTPHDADGVYGGTVGVTAGGEPPRWDGQPHPGQRWTGGGDDSAQGGERGTGVPPGTYWPGPYMDGWRDRWPEGGHGTQQAPGTSVGSTERGRPPNAVGKAADAASFLKDAPKAKASTVFAQLSQNYPPDSIAWVKRVSWRGPSEIPLPLIDWSGRKTWAADHETSRVGEFARQLQAHEEVHPVVAVAEPGKRRLRLIDGHHRALACRDLGWPVRAWIAEVSGKDAAEAFETHSSQVHQGDDPQND